MTKGIYLALSGAVAEGRALDNVAHNVANVGTTGFHPQRMSFAEALQGESAKLTPPVAVAGTTTDTRQGAISSTGNPLDLAIDGEGYFALETERGVRYTRSGAFQLDAEGTVVNHDGDAVLDEDGARIQVPVGSSAVSVGRDGTIAADGEAIAKIARVSFASGALKVEGNNFAAEVNAKAHEAPAEIVSGALERSSANAVQGMVELIRVSRSYEALARMIETFKQTDERAARAIGER